MKWFLIAISLLTVSDLKAQEKFIGQTKIYLQSTVSQDTSCRFLREELLNDSVTNMHYEYSKDGFDYGYTFKLKRGIVTMVTITDLLKQLPSWINTLNRSYIRTDNDTWVTKDYRYVITLHYEKTDFGFNIYYLKFKQ